MNKVQANSDLDEIKLKKERSTEVHRDECLHIARTD